MLSFDDVALVWKDSPLEQALFRHLEAQVDSEWMSTSRQGMYVFSVSGQLLGSEVLREDYDDAMTRVEPVSTLMRSALATYSGLDEGERLEPHDRIAAFDGTVSQVNAFDDERQSAALMLRVTGRDLPRDGTFEPHLWSAGGRWTPRSAFNLDYAWFRADEARSFLPEVLEVGEVSDVDEAIVVRLARFHFLNNVRCHTAVPHAREDVEVSELASRVLEVTDGVVTIRMEGRVRAAHVARTEWEKEWHGMDPIGFEGRLLGRAMWNVALERFTRFELVALGDRFGSDATRPGEPKTPIGFALELAEEHESDLVAPAVLQREGASKYWGGNAR